MIQLHINKHYATVKFRIFISILYLGIPDPDISSEELLNPDE